MMEVFLCLIDGIPINVIKVHMLLLRWTEGKVVVTYPINDRGETLIIWVTIDIIQIQIDNLFESIRIESLKFKKDLRGDETVRACLVSDSYSLDIEDACDTVETSAFELGRELMLERLYIVDVWEEDLKERVEDISTLRKWFIHHGF